MIYSYMVAKPNNSNQQIDLESFIDQEIKSFNRICESVSILTENSIAFEADGEGFFARIKKIWDKFKEWFDKHVLQFFRDLWKKIVESKLGKAIADLKSNISNKLKKTSFSTDPEKPSPETVDDMVDESVIMEAGRASILKRVVEKNICPELFFKLDKYCNASKLSQLSKEGVDLMKKSLDLTVKMNSRSLKSAEKDIENALEDPEVEDLYDKIGNLALEYMSIWNIPNITNLTAAADWEKVQEAIINDCTSEMKSNRSITFEALVSLVESNIKNASTDIRLVEGVLKDTNTVIRDTESIIDKSNGQVTRFTTKCLKDSLKLSKQCAECDRMIIKFVNDMYGKSAKLLASMKALNDLVL